MTSRAFDAPRELVWKAFTEPERMKQWWGPKGFTVIAAKMDLRPGGTYHYGMQAPDGATMWGKMVFREIAGADRFHQRVLGRGRRHHASPPAPVVAAGNAFGVYVRGAAKRQDQCHHLLVAP